MLLYKYGGIWNDASSIYLKPIDEGIKEDDEFVTSRDDDSNNLTVLFPI